MKRWSKFIAPMASLALLIGLQQAELRADDTAATVGKATVTVTVVDSAGKPVSGATVGIYPKPAKKHRGGAAAGGATTQPADGAKHAKAEPIATGETSVDGTVALTKVPDGEFSVRAKLRGAGNGTEAVTVTDDKDAAVSVTLKAKGAKK